MKWIWSFWFRFLTCRNVTNHATFKHCDTEKYGLKISHETQKPPNIFTMNGSSVDSTFLAYFVNFEWICPFPTWNLFLFQIIELKNETWLTSSYSWAKIGDKRILKVSFYNKIRETVLKLTVLKSNFMCSIKIDSFSVFFTNAISK